MTHEFEGTEIAIDAAEAEEMHEAMDYEQHRATWDGFTNLVKWAIIQIAFLLVALYCFIFAEQPVLGGLLILIGILTIPAGMLFGTRR